MRLSSMAVTHTNATRWRVCSWAHCHQCGEHLAGVLGSDEHAHDGDDLACLGCGEVHSLAVFVAPGDLPTIVVSPASDEDSEVCLRHSALAALRRLVGMDRPMWWGVSP